MKYGLTLLALSTIIAGTAMAEPLLLKAENNNLSLSIYNQNLALVKDIRTADLKSGLNEVIFDGVAERIQSETAIIYGDGIKVNEQNYSYNLMSYDNILRQYIGQEVTAVRINPENGKNIIEQATLISINGSQPIIKTEHGIDAEYPGRIVFDKVPANLSNKPMLTAKLNAKNAGNKTLNLAYLTDGLSWKTDYVANVLSPTQLNLTGWVTIKNESGIDYENAKIQLIAGDVNVVRNSFKGRGMVMMAKAAVFEEAADNMAYGSVEPEAVNSYELYTLPTTSTIKNHQNKQIALIEKTDVVYKKEFNLYSPFYFGNYAADEFEKRHPVITYVIENKSESNLGISLPSGTIRFYQNDKNGNLQFIGSNNIGNTAKEDTLRLNLGDAFNISVSGKVTKIKEKEINRKPKKNLCHQVKQLKTFDVSITVNNAEDTDNTLVFTQNMPQGYQIVKENIKGTEKNATTREWQVPTKKNSKTDLTFSVDIPFELQVCD
ncbi:MAG: hypothetical protein J6N49_05350 [Alphaproteobacteria bacterium]|nr:hypothetical protein [Alphaproteobacteria bacterium]